MRDPANSSRFKVLIDGFSLGRFSGFEGIGGHYETQSYAEGGENSFVHQLPGRLTWGNVRLKRPVDLRSKALVNWFLMLGRNVSTLRHTATVVAYNDNDQIAQEYTFIGIWPVRYTGPRFESERPAVAVETFEFSHNGLLA